MINKLIYDYILSVLTHASNKFICTSKNLYSITYNDQIVLYSHKFWFIFPSKYEILDAIIVFLKVPLFKISQGSILPDPPNQLTPTALVSPPNHFLAPRSLSITSLNSIIYQIFIAVRELYCKIL